MLLPGFEHLVSQKKSRHERVVKLTIPPFSRKFPRVCGRFSCLLVAENVLEIDERNHVIDLENGDVTSPARLARRIARRTIREFRVRRVSADVEEQLLALRLPHWAHAGVHQGSWARVDISRAFESILRIWGVREIAPLRWFSLEPIWVPSGRWIGPGEKHVLRVLPSVCASGQVRVELEHGVFQVIPKRVVDPRVWGTVVTVLSAVAELARREGAIYWNVDGGIVPQSSVPLISAFCEAIGLKLRVECFADEADIRAQYAYALRMAGRQVYVTGHYARIRLAVDRALSGDEQEFLSWALSKVEKAAIIRLDNPSQEVCHGTW